MISELLLVAAAPQSVDFYVGRLINKICQTTTLSHHDDYLQACRQPWLLVPHDLSPRPRTDKYVAMDARRISEVSACAASSQIKA